MSAQTGRTGFLHLPNEIRNRIYEDALFDHDRAVVLLPRRLPRKVLDDGFKICDAFMDAENRSQGTQDLLREVGFDSLISDVHEECKWVEEARPPEEVALPLFTEEDTDDEGTEERFKNRRSSNVWTNSWIDTGVMIRGSRAHVDPADTCQDCKLVYCNCIEDTPSSEEGEDPIDKRILEAEYSEASNDDEADGPFWDPHDDNGGDDEDGGEQEHDSDAEECYDSDGYLVPPNSCFKDHSMISEADPLCRFCGGFGLGPDEDEEAYGKDEIDNDDPYEEDDEHFDSEERIGMLFHTSEPGILLACKEIREQCLPIYYGLNAFSWRFFWGHQTRSLARFTEWTNVVGENARYISQISFEGRHSIEEGIEFEVDIDLLEESPFFDIAAECMHPGDELTDAIVEAIEQDFVTVLWRLSRRDRGEIKLSAEDLCLLGTIFSEVLERDPGMAGDRGQWDGKFADVPRNE